MNTINNIEELFLEADRALDEGNLSEGKRMLEDILHEEPSYGKAHNHLGWLYKTKYQDYKIAEKHFKLAIKFDPEYPPSYINYAYLLRDLGRLDELEALLVRAMQIESTNKCSLNDEFGSLYELKGDYKKAIEFYNKAIKLSLNDKIVEDLRNHVKRCRRKQSFFGRFRRWFSK
ncbi:MAG: O-linked GlcNAc transferase [Bacteroidota bacterium]